jgi:microcystin-dependent protein
MDVYAGNWNEDDNANTTVAPDGAPEGMAPSGVNNVLRAHQGAMKRFAVWSIPKTTGGGSTAYTLSYTVAPGALVDGMTHLVQFHVANGAAATLNVNGLGAIPLYYHAAGAWRAAPLGLIDVDEIWRVAYHTSSGTYRLLDLRNRTGEVVPFAGSTAPAGALLCYGQQVSRTTYAGLFAVIGAAYGGGDGSTTFNLPDLRGRVAAGKSDMGGSDAGNLTGGGVLGAALGAQAGSASVSGNVIVSSGAVGGTFNGNVTSVSINIQGGANATVAAIGDTVAGSIMTNAITSNGANTLTGTAATVQPTRVLNYLIRV